MKLRFRKGPFLQLSQPTTHTVAVGGNKLEGIISADSPQLTSQFAQYFHILLFYFIFVMSFYVLVGELEFFCVSQGKIFILFEFEFDIFQLKFERERNTRGGYYWHPSCSRIPGQNHMYGGLEGT